MSERRPESQTILYCHCQYAQVVPEDVKAAVLKELCASNQPFEAVPDLCELSARRDPSLRRLANGGPVKIAACFPRAVKWLFAAAEAPLSPDHTEIVNLRTEPTDQAVAALLSTEVRANLPADAPKVDAGQPVPATTS